MLLHDRRLLRLIGIGLSLISFCSFVVCVVQKVATGRWLEQYTSVRGVVWTYGNAFITLSILIPAFGAALVFRHLQKSQRPPPGPPANHAASTHFAPIHRKSKHRKRRWHLVRWQRPRPSQEEIETTSPEPSPNNALERERGQ